MTVKCGHVCAFERVEEAVSGGKPHAGNGVDSRATNLHHSVYHLPIKFKIVLKSFLGRIESVLIMLIANRFWFIVSSCSSRAAVDFWAQQCPYLNSSSQLRWCCWNTATYPSRIGWTISRKWRRTNWKICWPSPWTSPMEWNICINKRWNRSLFDFIFPYYLIYNVTK